MSDPLDNFEARAPACRDGSEPAPEPFPIDFLTDPEVVRVVAEGERLAYGHLFNPAFATEISMIDPLQHQRIAVYDHMLPQPRLRFLLGVRPSNDPGWRSPSYLSSEFFE